jgi:hypothetical protein
MPPGVNSFIEFDQQTRPARPRAAMSPTRQSLLQPLFLIAAGLSTIMPGTSNHVPENTECRGGVMKNIIESARQLVICQVKEWTEILVNFETSNRYEIQSISGDGLGYIIERKGGISDTLKRLFLRSHRPLAIDVLDKTSQPVYHLSRNFFFLFSDLYITDQTGQKLGSIHRRFGLLYKKYDLRDEYGNTFARIQAPVWRLWTFPVLDKSGRDVGVISKKWQGFLKEAFTDADRFVVDYRETAWTLNQKTVIMAAAISIDFDFFEDNQAGRG